MPVTTPSTPSSARAYAVELRPSPSTPPTPIRADVKPTAPAASSAKTPTTLASLLSSPFVQAAGGTLLAVVLVQAVRYLVQRYYATSSSASASSVSRSDPRGSNSATNPYETPTQLHEYLLMHYGLPSTLISHTDVADIPWAALHFPAECARLCVERLRTSSRWAAAGGVGIRALDVGCAVGRSSFELARYAQEVVAIDFSHSFVQAANQLKTTGRADYLIKIEGDITKTAVAEISPAIERSRVSFMQGDACALSTISPPLQPFHVVLAANLICRLPFPSRFLASLPALVVPHGFVLLLSPHSWLDDYTTREHWLGGYYDRQGRAVRTGQRIRELMEADGSFTLVEERNVPFFIRETDRKNQWSISHLQVFERTDK